MASVMTIRSVRQQVTDALRDDILAGRLADGERLSEVKLAQRFGVGRAVIREALIQLTHEGLAVTKANCGVKVAPPAPAALREVFLPIRRTIETYALKLIFDEIDEDDYRRWEEILGRMEDACRRQDLPALSKHNFDFHRSLLERANQADLLAIWQNILLRIRGHFWNSVKNYDRDLLAIHAEHRALVDVFRRGDKEAAVRALEQHIW
jgi:DNA-binding GntR family transcriptional regulator